MHKFSIENNFKTDFLHKQRFGTSGGTTYLKIRMSSTHALCVSGIGYASANTQGYMSLSMTRKFKGLFTLNRSVNAAMSLAILI